MSKALFTKLVNSVQSSSDRALADANADRWLKKLSGEDAELMSKAEVLEACIVTRHLRAAILVFESKKFLCISGQYTDDDLPDGFDAIELTPGFFTIAVANLKLSPTASAIEIFDAIDGNYKGMDDYYGHDLHDVARLFPEVSVFNLQLDAASTGSIWRILGILLSRYYGEGPIELSQDTLDELKELYETGSDHLPFRNILQGHLAMNWAGLFLELYRAIEQLFAVPKLDSLTNEWASKAPFFELAELLEKQLGWRPKEEVSLRELIENCSEPLLDALTQEFCPTAENKAKSVARAIYRQRNSLVHFRPAMPEEDLTALQWNSRVLHMIQLVTELYGKHGEAFKLPRP